MSGPWIIINKNWRTLLLLVENFELVLAVVITLKFSSRFERLTSYVAIEIYECLHVTEMKYHVVWFAIFSSVHSHPQCLDFDPPFIPSRPLQFCSNYHKYTCCTNVNDTDRSNKYHNIFESFNQQNFNGNVNINYFYKVN